MKGYRFYAELPDSWGSKSASKKQPAFTRKLLEGYAGRGSHCNCIAVPLEDDGRPMYQGSTLNFDAFGVVLTHTPRSVEGVSSNAEYLRKRCVRIDEALARRLHPQLFTYLERT